MGKRDDADVRPKAVMSRKRKGIFTQKRGPALCWPLGVWLEGWQIGRLRGRGSGVKVGVSPSVEQQRRDETRRLEDRLDWRADASGASSCGKVPACVQAIWVEVPSNWPQNSRWWSMFLLISPPQKCCRCCWQGSRSTRQGAALGHHGL